MWLPDLDCMLNALYSGNANIYIIDTNKKELIKDDRIYQVGFDNLDSEVTSIIETRQECLNSVRFIVVF